MPHKPTLLRRLLIALAKIICPLPAATVRQVPVDLPVPVVVEIDMPDLG